QISGSPVLFPGVGLPPTPGNPNPCYDAQGNTPDTDGDGLLDCWENGTLWSDGRPGISYNGVYFTGQNFANRDVQLCVSPFDPTQTFDPTRDCADALKKDIFVEIDYMGPPAGKTQSHKPDTTALNRVVTAFANAPTPPGPVRLQVQVDDKITHNDTTAFVPCTAAALSGQADFDRIKFPR